MLVNTNYKNSASSTNNQSLSNSLSKKKIFKYRNIMLIVVIISMFFVGYTKQQVQQPRCQSDELSLLCKLVAREFTMA